MLKKIINSALAEDEKNKGTFRKLFGFLGLGYDPTLKALRRLDLDKANEFQILKCFIKNMPRESQESFKVYQAILCYFGINKKGDVTLLTQSLKILNQSGYLTEQNFNLVKDYQDLSQLTPAFQALSHAHLLTQENFDVVKEHQNLSEFTLVLQTLNNVCLLTHKNFDVVKQIKKHQELAILASILMTLSCIHVVGDVPIFT